MACLPRLTYTPTRITRDSGGYSMVMTGLPGCAVGTHSTHPVPAPPLPGTSLILVT